MTRYNKYAKALDSAVKNYRENYIQAATRYKDNKAYYERKMNDRETAQLDRDRAKMNALENYQTFETDVKKLNDSYKAEVDRLTREAETEAQRRVNPDDVDPAALSLLNSGIMQYADYESMAERYKSNDTMRRLIADYAEKASYSDKIPEADAPKLRMMNYQIQHEGDLGAWRELASSAAIMTGTTETKLIQKENVNAPDVREAMLNRWEEVTAGTIEDF